MRLSAYHLGLLLAVSAACGFAAKAIFAKMAYRYGVDGVTLVTLRLLLVLPLLLLFRLLHPGRHITLLARSRMARVVGIVGILLIESVRFPGAGNRQRQRGAGDSLPLSDDDGAPSRPASRAPPSAAPPEMRSY